MMLMLSPNFGLAEFTTSQIAVRMERIVEAGPHTVANLTLLCSTLLEPIREAIGRPIHISSGYRPEWLNAMTPGSSKHSAHTQGCAADISASGMTPLELAVAIRALKLPDLDECILEFPPGGWVHVAVAAPGTTPRRLYITSQLRAGKTSYAVGLLPLSA